MIAPAGGYTVWGCVPGEPWHEYQSWPSEGMARRMCASLTASAPHRMYHVQRPGEAKPETVLVPCRENRRGDG